MVNQMKPVSIGLALAGAILMGLIGGKIDALFGLVIGYLVGVIGEQERRLKNLESHLLQAAKVPSKPSPVTVESALYQPKSSPKTESDESLGLALRDPALSLKQSENLKAESYQATQKRSSTSHKFQAKAGTAPQKSIQSLLMDYLTGGNLMVRAGVIVLFFGFAFIVKYATERNLIPIELRLTGVALFATGLTILGVYLKEKRPSYGLSLQGGGIGVLYLTIFAAAKLYELMPLVMALAFMIILVGVATFLALLQNARSLAVLGTVGGFLAPILTAGGAGNHLLLFSYYLLLNIGILAAAWFKAWRELNLLGFIFTFGIGTLWGVRAYQAQYLFSTELFLIVFFLIYFLVSILFSLRQPLNLKGYVDSTLVFGLPLTTFGLQSGLVGETEFGLALSAVFLAALYITAATILWRFHKETVRVLIEAFLALGVIFTTLAVPLAVNGHWTAGTWALEGGALFWMGVRQRRLTARLAGLVLQAGAAISLLIILITTPSVIAISGGLLALSGFFVSYLIYSKATYLYNWEGRLAPLLLALALIGWFGAGIHDIHSLVAPSRSFQVAVMFVAVSLAFFSRIGLKLKWSQMCHVGLGLMPFMLILAWWGFENRIKANPFRHGWWLVWPFTFGAFYNVLKSNQTFWPQWILKSYHLTGALLLLFLLTWDAAYWVDYLINTTETWPLVVWGLVPGLGALLLLHSKERFGWPFRSYLQLYQHQTVAVILLYLLIWCLTICFEQGDPAPLMYLPILNPIDLMILFMFLLILRWNQKYSDRALTAGWMLPVRIKGAVIGLFGCIWLSALVLRTIHFWEEVPYEAPNLATSALVQTSLSVLWSLYAMAVLFYSTKKGLQGGWIAGAGLLAIVVIKLFLIDLSGTGTIARIISFVAVGLLMLIIGYFSPLPPSRQKEGSL
jgi:uncharacterized membrane protein